MDQVGREGVVSMRRLLAVLVAFVSIAIVGLVLACCISESRLNDNPAEYVVQVGANYYYAKGHSPSTGADGIRIFFRLADSSWQMTTSDGMATITIVDKDRYPEVLLYSEVFEVKKSDFKKRTYGVDWLDREVYIECEFPPLMYAALGASERASQEDGEIRIEFETSDGRILTGYGWVFLPGGPDTFR